MAAFNALNGGPRRPIHWLLTDVLRSNGASTASSPPTGSASANSESRHRGGRRGGRAQGHPRRGRHGHDGPALHQAPARRGARRPGAGKRGRRGWSRRVLRAKFRLGLFDRPDIDPSHWTAILPVAGIAPGGPCGRTRNVRLLQEPRRGAADCSESRIRCGRRAPCRRGPRPARPARSPRPKRRTASRLARASGNALRRRASGQSMRRAATCSARNVDGIGDAVKRPPEPTSSSPYFGSRRSSPAKPRRAPA